ncbi:hypothetical protein QBC39DRAFT_358046 [Podospora conica]|nr:hypothetical protein QBC39DRAFT_358046 [Schizothecium conicum]
MASPRESDFTQAAPYGQACDNCSRSKAKCMRRPPGQPEGPCQRCHHRGRDCVSTSRSRQKQKRSPGVSRTAHLEAKLDSLVSLLQSSHQPALPLPPTLSTPSATTGTPSLSGDGDTNLNTPAEPISAPGLPLPTQPAGWPLDVSEDEAGECLERFCSNLHHFPFITISPSETAATLQRDRPILWQCILAVSTNSLSRRQALGSHLRSLFADKLVVQHERSLDLLLGLLAYMGWSNHQMGAQQLFLCMYCHLLTGLVQDLGLDQPPKRSGEPHPMSCLKPQGLVMRLAFPVACTMEARRAAIATFVITSEIVLFRAFAFHQVIDRLRWTPQMEEHLQVLIAVQEAPSDAILAHMAQLKLIGNETTRSIQAHSLQPSDTLRSLQIFQANSLQLRLDRLRKEAGSLLDADDILRLHTISIELEINDVSLSQMPSDASSAAPDMERLAMLSKCVQCTRAWFDIFFGLDPATYAMFGFSIWAQLSHLIVSLYRLTLLNEPWWDRDMVRRTIDLNQVLDEMLDRMTQVSKEGGDSKEIMFYPVKSIRAIKAAWAPLLAPKPTGEATTSTESADLGGSDVPMSEPMPGLMEDFDGWMDMFTMAWVNGDITA